MKFSLKVINVIASERSERSNPNLPGDCFASLAVTLSLSLRAFRKQSPRVRRLHRWCGSAAEALRLRSARPQLAHNEVAQLTQRAEAAAGLQDVVRRALDLRIG